MNSLKVSIFLLTIISVIKLNLVNASSIAKALENSVSEAETKQSDNVN